MKTSSPPIPFLFTPPSPFAVPPGNYRAVLRTVSTDEDELEEGKLLLRLVFDIVAGEDGQVNYSACLEYPQDENGHARLNDDLVAFLDPGEIEQMLGMPAEIDLGELVGTEVDMAVATFTGRDEPQYSRVTGIYPAATITGRMVSLDEDCLAAQVRKKWMTPVEGFSLV
jgi:hypothetical protein